MEYTDANLFLHTRGKAVPRKKYANNTYLERREVLGIRYIDLRLHATVIVTWSHDGMLRLDTGGWLTVTTKARMNDVLPGGWVLSSSKGTWTLRHVGSGASYRYTDGLTMRRLSNGSWDVVVETTLPESQQVKDDRHNDAMRKLIGRYLKDMPEQWDTEPRLCHLCLGTWQSRPSGERGRYIAYGDALDDTQHLIDHMLDRTYPHALLIAAVTQQGYTTAVLDHPSITRRAVRSYLCSRLYVGATAPVHGKKPLSILHAPERIGADRY